MSFMDPNDPGRWDRAIDMLQRCGDYAHVPLLEAAKRGVIDMAFSSNRTASLPFGKIRASTKPVLVLLGDDDDTPTGPNAWRVAEQVCRWARGAIVHGAGMKRYHYELAVAGTVECRRFLVVDTASQFVPSWMALLGHVQALAIIPTDGPHPVAEPARSFH